MKQGLVLFVAALFGVLVGSCATTADSIGENLSIRQPPDPLNLELSYELLFLRVNPLDMSDRRTERTEGLGSRSSDQISSFGSGYLTDYPGIYIGNGLFVDMNGNLWIDVARLYDLQDTESFTLVEKTADMGRLEIEYARNGNIYTRTITRPVQMEQRFVVTSNALEISDSISTTRQNIVLVRDSHAITSIGPIGGLTIQKADPGSIEITGLAAATTFSGHDENLVQIDSPAGTIQIQRESDRIDIAFTLFGGQYNRTYSYVRTPDGCLFFDPSMQGVEVRKEGKLIYVIVNGDRRRTFEILGT